MEVVGELFQNTLYPLKGMRLVSYTILIACGLGSLQPMLLIGVFVKTKQMSAIHFPLCMIDI